MELRDHVAIVTGAGRGIGWGVATAFARSGARVCVADVNDDDIARAVDGMRQAGAEAVGHHLDVADPDAFAEVVAKIAERWGRVDTLVHCAIHMPLAPLREVDVASWRRQLAVGLDALYYGVRAVRPHFERQGAGHVIGVASGSSVRGYHDEVAYCAIKHGQEGFVKALALEREPAMAVNTMGPGRPVKPTRMTWDELESLPEEAKSGWTDPAELGRAFVWLAAQPPERFRGLRFDAGPIVDALDRHGDDFAFEVERVTLYPDDFRARMSWMESYRA